MPPFATFNSQFFRRNNHYKLSRDFYGERHITWLSSIRATACRNREGKRNSHTWTHQANTNQHSRGINIDKVNSLQTLRSLDKTLARVDETLRGVEETNRKFEDTHNCIKTIIFLQPLKDFNSAMGVMAEKFFSSM